MNPEMNERVGKRTAAAPALLATVLLGFFSPAPAAAKEPWNLLLVTVDTLRADRLSCYGFDRVRTANIDRLAARGTVFTRAFAHTPTTLPSHANILLGTTPLGHGVHDNSGFVVRPELETLAERLKREGYATAAFVGAYPLDSRFGLDQGFDVYDDDFGSQSARGAAFYVERKAEAVVGRALAWLEKAPASPWFVWVHCFDPHEPYAPPPPHDERFAESPYDGEVAYVDEALGPLFGRLESAGLLDRTLIVLTGDHGESLGEHGEATHAYFAYNATIWVPLILCLPGGRAGRSDAYVAHMDVFPTVCDALDVKAPRGLPGVSLLPAVRGKALRDRPLYFESLYPYYSRGWAPQRGVILDRKKYIESPLPELYDMEKDFAELENLAGRVRRDEHLASLAKWMKSAPAADEEAARGSVNAETLRRLRSLGYVSGAAPARRAFGPRDDVKTLLPYHNRCMEAKDLFQSGAAGRAEEMLRAVLAERPDVDVAYSNLALICREGGRLDEALDVLREGLARLPSNYAIYSTYLNFLVAAGRYDEVVEAASDVPLRQAKDDPEFWNYLGIARANRGESGPALEAFDRGAALDPGFASLLVNRGTLHLSRFLKTKDPADGRKAAADYERAVASDPGNATAHNGLGLVARLSGDPAGAVRSFEKALELRPGYQDARFNLAMAWLDGNEPARALKAFEDYRRDYGGKLQAADRNRLGELIRECRRRAGKSQ